VDSSRIRVVVGLMAVVIGGLVLPSDALAQHRGHGRVVVVGGGFYPYYSPFYWGAFYGSPFWGPYGYWPPYYGFYPAYDYASEVRVLATPREAEVYVDGYLVGTVDDFDGWSQRLRLQPGEHEIELYLEGYRSVRQKTLFRPGETYKIRAVLERADPGEAPAARPLPIPGAAPATGPDPYPGGATNPLPPAGAHGFGTLAIRVQPGDATVLVDGERWDRPAGEVRLTLELSAGSHQVEVRKDGYTTYTATVQIRSGEVTPLNVSLPSQP
jgi:hypothetical protein